MSILALIGIFFAVVVAVVLVMATGVTIYELVIVKHDPLDTRDYMRSYDWTTTDQ